MAAVYRWDDLDRSVIARIKERYGLRYDIDALRHALKYLDTQRPALAVLPCQKKSEKKSQNKKSEKKGRMKWQQ